MLQTNPLTMNEGRSVANINHYILPFLSQYMTIGIFLSQKIHEHTGRGIVMPDHSNSPIYALHGFFSDLNTKDLYLQYPCGECDDNTLHFIRLN